MQPDHYNDVMASPRWHPYGAHGVLIAAPLSLLLWGVIALAVLLH